MQLGRVELPAALRDNAVRQAFLLLLRKADQPRRRYFAQGKFTAQLQFQDGKLLLCRRAFKVQPFAGVGLFHFKRLQPVLKLLVYLLNAVCKALANVFGLLREVLLILQLLRDYVVLRRCDVRLDFQRRGLGGKVILPELALRLVIGVHHLLIRC